jgi:DNA-binding NarL/FixJ family response regulator
MLNECQRTQMEVAAQGVQRRCVDCGACFMDCGAESQCGACRSVKPENSTGTGGASLTYRERQIVRLIQHANTNREISAKLGLSYGTTKQYICAIFRKVGVRNRTELAIRKDLLEEASAASSGSSHLGSQVGA